jgi:phosphotransferase system HPr-like phosphotransfer protein
MNTPLRAGFVNPLLVCTLFGLGCSGSAGVATVWLQHQISITANENKGLEARIAAIRRESEQLTAEIAFESDSAALLQRNSQMKLGMVAPAYGQEIFIAVDPVNRYSRKQSHELFSQPAAGLPGLPLALGH